MFGINVDVFNFTIGSLRETADRFEFEMSVYIRHFFVDI